MWKTQPNHQPRTQPNNKYQTPATQSGGFKQKGINIMDDKTLWKEFHAFRLYECLGFWIERIIEYPYGTLCLFHPSDDVPYFNRGNLNLISNERLLSVVEEDTRRFSYDAGFLFSSAWTGDVNKFQNYIANDKYESKYKHHWLVKEKFDDIDKIRDSGYRVELTNDGESVKRIFNIGFGGDDAFGQMVKDKIENNVMPVKTDFYLAYDGDKPIACAGVSYDEKFGYLHCLATLPEYRGRGVASHLVKARMQFLNGKKIPYAVTCVNVKNDASLAVQKKFGYRIFETTDTWKK